MLVDDHNMYRYVQSVVSGYEANPCFVGIYFIAPRLPLDHGIQNTVTHTTNALITVPFEPRFDYSKKIIF